MASTLLLALSASAALIAGPALACEGQGCWGMAPAQDLNPGYSGPDYSQFAPPPEDGYGPGPDAGPYRDGGPGPGFDAANDPRPYVGPIEGLRDQQQARAYQSAGGYGYDAQAYGPPPPAYDDGADDGPGPDGDRYGPAPGYAPTTAYGSQGAYGPPRDYSPAEGDLGSPEGEPPSAYAMAHPAPAYGYDGGGYAERGQVGGDDYAGGYRQHSYAAPYHHGWRRQAFAADTTPPPPYQVYSSHGYEHSSSSPPSAEYQSHSYRAGSVSQYDYDSGWVEDTGRGPDWSAYPPADAPDAYGPPPPACGRCTVEH